MADGAEYTSCCWLQYIAVVDCRMGFYGLLHVLEHNKLRVVSLLDRIRDLVAYCYFHCYSCDTHCYYCCYTYCYYCCC